MRATCGTLHTGYKRDSVKFASFPGIIEIILKASYISIMDKRIQIRPARPTDANAAAILLYSAYTHTIMARKLQEEEEDGFLQRLRVFFQQEDNRFSYQNSCVAEYEHQIVGLVSSFGGRDEIRLNEAVERQFPQTPGQPPRRLEREAENDEWYIDALAVFSGWGRKGIGTHLLQISEQEARDNGYKKIALNVAKENQHAFRLYKRIHYQPTGETVLYQQPYIRMVKEL